MRDDDSPHDKKPTLIDPAKATAAVMGGWMDVWTGQWMTSYQQMSEIISTMPNMWSMNGLKQLSRNMDGFMSMLPQVDSEFHAWCKKHQEDSLGGKLSSLNAYNMERELEFLPAHIRAWVKVSLMADPQLQRFFNSNDMATALEYICALIPGSGELYQPEYNHRFLEESANGEVGAADTDAIVRLFQEHDWDKREDFPRIILTASHARADTLGDMRQVTHGISALARDASGKKLHVVNSQNTAAPGSIMLFACDTHKNPGLNAGELLRRLNELERAGRGEAPDRFKYMNPGAKRMAKLMLKCMAVEPSKIDIDSPKSISQLFGSGDRLLLRPDAARIAQHFQLMGYSKAGNTVSDAMRYLVHELKAKGPRGNDLVWIAAEHEHRPISDFGNYGVRSIVRNIGVMSIAAREVELSDEEVDCGVRRVAFNNRHDMIALHSNYSDRPRDANWVVEGVEKGLGHDPVDALGSDAGPGYMVKDERVRRRVKEFMGPHHGKATIGRIGFFNDPAHGDAPCVTIETAPGTSDELFARHRDTILAHMREAGLTNPEITGGQNGRSFQLCADENLLQEPDALKKLHKAFSKLRESSTRGLVIADTVLREDIPSQLRHLGQERQADALENRKSRSR